MHELPYKLRLVLNQQHRKHIMPGLPALLNLDSWPVLKYNLL